MSSSKDPDIRKLYLASSSSNVISDEIVEQAKASRNKNQKKQAKDLQTKQIMQSTWSEFIQLKKENIIIKFLTDNVSLTRITSWQKVVKWLPDSIFSFCRRYLILALPTKCNLKTWNLTTSNICSLCNKKSETLHHIVSNCSISANEGRFTWRHNSVLYTILSHVNPIVNDGYLIYADIEGYANPGSLFRSVRPDIVIVKDKKYFIIELTVCFETNLIKSHEYKIDKYKNIKVEVMDKNVTVEMYAVEFSCLGFSSNALIAFTKLLRTFNVDVKRMISKCSEVCCRTSYYIFNRRGKLWQAKDILKFD